MFDRLLEKRVQVYNEKIKQTQKEMKFADYFQKEVDYRANVHNQSAKEFYEKCGAKVLEYSYESSQKGES